MGKFNATELFVSVDDHRWYQSLDQIHKDFSAASDTPSSTVVHASSPTIPIKRQWLAFCNTWFHDRFFPLDGHWMVRWDNNSPEISLSLWLVQELPRRGAYASQSPWESIPPESLVGRFLFQPTRDNTWQFVWVPAAKGLSCPIVATVTLDSVGLIHVVEQSSWQDIVFAAVRAIPPTQWGNPRALRRVKRNRWITALIKIVIGEVFALPFRWIFLALFVPQHSPSTNDIGFSASMAVFTLVQGVVTIAVPIAVIGGLFRNPKPNCGLAQNPATSPTVLAAWAKSGDAKLRLAVAGNPSTPSETLMHLSKDRFSRDKRTYPIRHAPIHNPNFPGSTEDNN